MEHYKLSKCSNLNIILSDDDFQSDLMIDYLEYFRDDLKVYFDTDAGVSEGYTIEEHSIMVYDILLDQIPYYDLNRISHQQNIDFEKLFKVLIAVHDIGKGLAIEAGDKRLQHHYTLPIVERVLTELGYNESEIAVAKALVGHDALGQLLTRRINVQKAYEIIVAMAQKAEIPLKDFFHLQTLYYTSDATSYPYVKNNFFHQSKSGKVVPNDPYQLFRQLSNMFE